MAEYINREQAIDWFSEYLYTNQSVQPSVLLYDLKTIPAADVAPVVHGRWEFRPFYKGTSRGVIECQVCKSAFDGSVGFNYCPNCGAKMDLEG